MKDWMSGGVVDNDAEEARDAARYAEPDPNDGPTRAEAEADAHAEQEYDRQHPRCREQRVVQDTDGVKWIETCSLRNRYGKPHAGNHEPSPWGRTRWRNPDAVCEHCGQPQRDVVDTCGSINHPPF